MKHTVRLLRLEDFDRCWAIATHRDKFLPAEANRLKEVWAYLLPRDEMRGAVVEEVGNGDKTRVVSFGATMPETAVNSALWCMFHSNPPVLGFSPRQKQVFSAALDGRSNRAIAEGLGVSEKSVHNCFRAGYDKMKDHPPLPSELDEERKRQRFLEILRTLKEEVRPWSARPVLKRHDGPIFAKLPVSG